jgi:hypothetical protein
MLHIILDIDIHNGLDSQDRRFGTTKVGVILTVSISFILWNVGNPLNPATESAQWRSGQGGLVIMYIERSLSRENGIAFRPAHSARYHFQHGKVVKWSEKRLEIWGKKKHAKTDPLQNGV